MVEPNRPDRYPPDRYSLDRPLRDRLAAEAAAPYRGLRRFAYGAIAASGAIGAFIFFFKVLAGRDLAASVPNLAFQMGLVALMVVLFRWENRAEERSRQRRAQTQAQRSVPRPKPPIPNESSAAPGEPTKK